MIKYIASGLLIFSHVVLVGMKLEIQGSKELAVPSFKGCPSIKYEVSSCTTPKCKELVDNYYQCTRALGGYAQEDNREAFRHTWYFHQKVREYELNLNIAKKDQQVSVLDTAMEWYKKSYDTEGKVRDNIDKLTVKVFERKNGEMLSQLCRGRSLVVPHVKTKDLFESLWVMHNVDLVYKYHDTYGYEDKPKTFEWIIKNGGKPYFIAGLINENYIAIDANKDGKTPAHLAIEHDRFDLLDCLFARGVNVNGIDAHGRTPLHYAASYADVRSTQLLLAYEHIDKNIVDNHGKKAIDYTNLSLKKQAKLYAQGEDISALKERYKKIHDLLKIS